jgi:hypothetical protein
MVGVLGLISLSGVLGLISLSGVLGRVSLGVEALLIANTRSTNPNADITILLRLPKRGDLGSDTGRPN